MSKVYYLQTPIKDEDIQTVNVGDIIYITGVIVTGRDAVHTRLLEEGKPLPIDLRGLALYHAGPAVRRVGSEWEVVAIGPTTSMRMENWEAEFIKRTGVKVIVGKGFMGSQTAEACRNYKCLVTMFPGGCGVLAAKRVEKVLNVHWLDLGVPEALWVLKVKEFGPLLVTIDTLGNNMYYERSRDIEERKKLVLSKIR